MLNHWPRAPLPTLSEAKTPLGGWLRGRLARAHVNTVVVVLATQAGTNRLGVDPERAEVQNDGCDGVVVHEIGQGALTEREKLTESVGGESEMA
jgi:hypothetical protein